MWHSSIAATKMMLVWLLVFGHAEADATSCLAAVTTPAQMPCLSRGRYHLDGPVLFVEGRIDAMLYDLFKREGLEQSLRHIELNSFGGNLEYAYLVAEIIRTRRMTTHIRAGARCASTCTILYQAGVERSAHYSAWLGYHGVRSSSARLYEYRELCSTSPSSDRCSEFLRRWYSECAQGTEKLFAVLERYGASPALFRDYRMLGVEADWADKGNCFKIRNWRLSASEAQLYRLVLDVQGSGGETDDAKRPL